jgi:hypothetical protein
MKNIKILAEKNIFHTDYKPANFALKRVVQSFMMAMIIDCGSASFDWKEIKDFTYRYLMETKNMDDLNWSPTFETLFARLKTEFRLLARTVFSLAT